MSGYFFPYTILAPFRNGAFLAYHFNLANIMLKKIAKYSIVLLVSSSAVIYAQQPARAGFLDDVLYFIDGFKTGVEIGDRIDRSRNSDGTINLIETTRAVRDGVQKLKDKTDRYQSSQEQDDTSSSIEEHPSDVVDDEVLNPMAPDDSAEDYSKEQSEDYSETE